MKRTNAGKQRKVLAARILCGLLLGAYLTGGYQPPVRAAALNVYGNNFVTADGSFASAWGYGTDEYNVIASGFTSTAFGWGTKAEGNESTAWGQITAAYGGASTAFGWNTRAMGKASTAFGNSSEAGGYAATAFGIGSKARSDYSTAFGKYTVAAGEDSTAFGYFSQAGQLLYGTDNTEAIIRRYYDGSVYKYKIVDANDTSKTLEDGFASYEDAYEKITTAGNQATAFGYKTKATGERSTAWGNESTASGTASTAFGVETIANTKGSTAWGDQTLAGKATIDGTEYSGTYATAFGYGTKASGTYATAFGSLTTASGPVATAWGVGTKASGNRSTAFGDNTTASGFAATAWGTFAIASGKASTAFGDSSQAMAENSLAALGGITDEAAANSAAIGNGAKVTVADTVALGSGSVASREKGDKNAYMKGSNSGSAWESTRNAIAVGDADNDVTRQITGVAAGSKDTDAVNVAQLKAAGAETSATLGLMSSAINDLQALTAGFPEGKTIKQTMDEGLDTKANKDMDNLSEAGKTAVKDLAKGAVNVVGEGPVSVVKSDVSGVDTYTVSVKADGKVESGDTGLVTGGTVYTAIAGKADAADLSALDTRVTANEGNISANTSSISALDSRVTAAESAVATNISNISALDGRVTQNESDIADTKAAIGTTADGTYVKESNTVGENLNALDTQVAALAGGAGADIAALSNRISNVDSKVNKAGAGAAALAALHPIDTDSKFTMGAGFGSYHSANAMALGLFYRPTDQVMLSIGGAMGNGENMVNAGISFALDKGVNTSKAAMARKIAAQDERIAAQDAELKAQKKENEEQKAEIRALKEALARIEAMFGK